MALLKGATSKDQLKNALKTVQATLKSLKATKGPKKSKSLLVKSEKAVKQMKNEIKNKMKQLKALAKSKGVNERDVDLDLKNDALFQDSSTVQTSARI